MERKKVKNINGTLFIYVIVSLVIAITISISINQIINTIGDNIRFKYIDDLPGYYDMFNEYYKKFGDGIPIPQIEVNNMSNRDAIIIEICDFVETWSPFFLISASVFTALSLFYRKRLEAPFKILEDAAIRIGKQELDFQINYQKNDELGYLCQIFNNMRNRLYINNGLLRTMVDEQKQMRTAFAHDLRTPLSILKGYIEFLIRYFPNEEVSMGKVMEILEEISAQISRIEKFADTMKQINHLDEIIIRKETIPFLTIYKKTENVLNTLTKKYNKEYSITFYSDRDVLQIDENIYLEIVENIVINAIRFCKISVGMELHNFDNKLIVIVFDDGPGFTDEELLKAKRLYYHKIDNEEDHYGIGLFMCDNLCRKHGGSLELSNLSSGGACVIATISS